MTDKIDRFYFSIHKKKLSTRESEKVKSTLMKLGSSSGSKGDVAWAYYRVAWLYYYQSKYNESIQEFFKCLKIAEEIKDSSLIGNTNAEIADSYMQIRNSDFATRHLNYAFRYLNPEKKVDRKVLDLCYQTLSNIYRDKGKIDSALKYANKRLDFALKRKNKSAIAGSYNTLALVYKEIKDYGKALQFFEKSLEIRREQKEPSGIAIALINMGNTFRLKGDIEKAILYSKEGVDLAFSSNSTTQYRVGLQSLSENYYVKKDYKNAFEYLTRYNKVRDSLYKFEMNKQLNELTALYEVKNKDHEIELKEAEIRSSVAENSKQRIMIIASGIALVLCFIAIFFIYRSFQLNKRNAKVLAEKNHLIEEKNKEITDSINYAKLIQQSLLASKDMLDRNLKEYFILYQPKDIVSGDFYWATESSNGFSIACVDCTGHGVPGAFMSLIGKENLDKASSKNTDPGKILEELNRGVKRSLNQAISGGKDGMDAALLKLEFNDNIQTLKYAGANRPLWIVRNSELQETKATKHAVGGITADDTIFEEHIINVNRGDMIYISTDGFADQFGYSNNKKLTTKRFKELLVSLSVKKANEQRQDLETFFHEWKGKNEQLDDLLVIGIRV